MFSINACVLINIMRQKTSEIQKEFVEGNYTLVSMKFK